MSQANSTNTVNNKISVNDLNEYALIDQPLSLDEIRARRSEIKRKLFIGKRKLFIGAETRGQSNNQKWFDYRFGRMAASKCYRIACSHKTNTSPTKNY